MNAILIATIPSVRLDGTALAPTDIASITFQKTVTGSPAQTLATNSATAGAGLTPDQITFTDAASAAGDSYTAFVTDVSGNAGAVSEAVVNPGAGGGTLSPPGAPTLSATFS